MRETILLLPKLSFEPNLFVAPQVSWGYIELSPSKFHDALPSTQTHKEYARHHLQITSCVAEC